MNDTEYRKQEADRVKAWRKANRAKVAAYTKARRAKAAIYNKAWREANRARVYAYAKAWRETSEERLVQNAARTKAWCAANPGRKRAYDARRRAMKIQATPPWVNHEEFREIYEVAALFGMHVDHIHPLKGKNFCGLHVPWNLRVVSPRENLRKHNKLLPEFVS